MISVLSEININYQEIYDILKLISVLKFFIWANKIWQKLIANQRSAYEEEYDNIQTNIYVYVNTQLKNKIVACVDFSTQKG